MAKIPKVKKGGVPSAVTSGEGVKSIVPGVLDTAAKVLGGAAEIGLSIEAAEAKKHAIAKAKKKAVLNEVELGGILSDYDTIERDFSRQTKDTFFNSPEQAQQAYESFMKDRMGELITSASNNDVVLKATKALRLRFTSGSGRLAQWDERRQSQIAENTMAERVRVAAAGAADAGSSEGLGAYISTHLEEMDASLVGVMGRAGAEKAKKEFKEEATLSYVNNASLRNSLRLVNELESNSGPLAENLNSSQRAEAMRRAVSGRDRAMDIRDMDLMRKSSGNRQRLVKALGAGELDVRELFGVKFALLKSKRVLPASGLPKEQINREIATIDEELKFLDAIESSYRRQRREDPIDETGTLDRILKQQRALLNRKSKKGKPRTAKPDVIIRDLRKQQMDIAIAQTKGMLTPGTAGTLMLSLGEAVDSIEAVDLDASLWDFNPAVRSTVRNSGADLLENKFKTRPLMATELKHEIELDYLDALNRAKDDGVNLSAKDAEDLATAAFNSGFGIKTPPRKR